MWACDPALTSTIVDSYQMTGPLFTQALRTILAAQCAIAGDHIWPPDATQQVLEDPNYDFIVVGAGSAGSVVANRLSEVSQWKILLVEAGGNPTLGTETPLLFYGNMQTGQDWQYKTQPQEGACRGYKNKGCAWPRGKVLGGTSSINAMFYVRGNKIDYDEWAMYGNTGWSYKDVLPYFMKSENFSGPLNNKKYHSKEGYLNVERPDSTHEFENLVITAAVETGMKHINDVNSENQMGVARSFTTTKNKMRHSTARAFLSPIKHRKNLHVIRNAHATKILFESNTVRGVVINKDGNDIIVNVKKELILSAGSINTPQLLMLSGIGPRKHLEDLNIEVKADLPVGENLQDHLFVPTYYTAPGDKSMLSLPSIFSFFFEYMTENKGTFGDIAPHRIISFFNTTDTKAMSPDVQFHYIFFPPSLYNMIDVYHSHDLNDDIYKKYNEMNTDHFTLIVYNVLLRPKSKGRILLKSRDPKDYPLIYSNYFNDPDDMATLIKAIKQHTLKLNKTKAFESANIKLQWLELDACKNYEKESDDFLECIARELTFSLYHPTGTAKMGPEGDLNSVVDPQLKVHKVKGLRVIDASIMPNIVRGNTNAPVIMIGEKGADMIKKEWLNKHAEL